MRKLIPVTCLIYALSLSAQTKAPAQPVAKPSAPHSAAQAAPPAPSATVTADQVDSFMKHMFGFQPGATWKVVEIAPDDGSPEVTRVVIQIGNQSQALYVLPGGKFALAGDEIPFGADPFAPARDKLKAEADGMTRGAKDAPVTLVEFTDLQCPHCKTAQPFIEQLVAESPDAKLIYQPFPLPIHPWAKQAAEYSQCVRQQNADAAWKFNASVYSAQADINETNAAQKFAEFATAAGADAAAATACAATPAIAAKVKKSIDLGLSVGVNATPTLFIEGRRVLGIDAQSLPSLKAMISYEAAQAKK